MGARGVDPAHANRGEVVRRCEVSFDYCFMKEVSGGATATVLVGRDRRSGLYLGHVVPAEGSATEWVSMQVIRDLKKMGYHVWP